MIEIDINVPVLVHSASLGPYVGILRDCAADGRRVQLGPARTLIKWRQGDTYIDIASRGLTKRDGSVSHQLDEVVTLTDVTAIVPLTKTAVRSIAKASEDGRSMVEPAD